MISIVIPCHNAASTIKDAYQSIPEAGKTSLELEIIFADDGSSDDTPGLLQLIADSDMRVKVVSNERNLGVSEARNKAIEAARGELIFFIDADDKLRPGALEIMAREMTEDVDFVRAKHYLWDPASGKHTENIGEELNFPELHAVRPDQFPQMSAIYSSWNALLRRSLIMDSGLRGPTVQSQIHHGVPQNHVAKRIHLPVAQTDRRKPASHTGSGQKARRRFSEHPPFL